MAHYSISKRARKNGHVYCVRVREKESGVVTFSTSKTFSTKATAVGWAKMMVAKVEKRSLDMELGLTDCTLGELISRYIEAKNNSNKRLRRTAIYSLRQHDSNKSASEFTGAIQFSRHVYRTS